MLIALLLVLAACTDSTQSVENFRLDPPPASLTIPCAQAAELPERVLTQAEVESFWLADRRRLAECRSRYKRLIEWAAEAVKAAET